MPSNPIRTQTATALKNPAHSYRIALDEAFEGKVKVFEISEIENIRPQDLRDNVCVVVGTIQSLRVTSTEGRDVYAHKEAFDPSCKIEAIITVQALKEGWDCSFAYVFCSTANIGSSKDVEQLLGRVLRMPYARRRKTPELNKAYAHVSSPNFMLAAKQLETSMIAMGFEETEAQEYIEYAQPSLPNLPLFLQQNPLRLTVAEPLNFEGLSERERESIVVTSEAPGKIEIEVHGPITPHIQRAALAAIPEAARGEAEKIIRQHIAEQLPHLAPSQSGGELMVPQLCVRYEGELLPFDKELVLDAAAWDLSQYPVDLSDFRFNDTSKTFEFDVQGSKVVYEFKGEQQLDLNLMAGDWTENDLIRWLDKELQQRDTRRDIRQEASLAWLRGCVRQLLDRKGFDLALLVRAKFILLRKLAERRDECRAVAYNAGYQEMLFGPNAAPETSFEYSFQYNPDVYPAHTLYTGKYRFAKHFYPVVGDLEPSGEEFECALALDAQSGLKHWVRNLDSQETASMWLQTRTDKFYPDFVAELLDGRILMVEYKGAHLMNNPDSDEKKLLGELWESKSNGRALFLMAVKKDARALGPHEQIKAKIEGW